MQELEQKAGRIEELLTDRNKTQTSFQKLEDQFKQMETEKNTIIKVTHITVNIIKVTHITVNMIIVTLITVNIIIVTLITVNIIIVTLITVNIIIVTLITINIIIETQNAEKKPVLLLLGKLML